MNTKNYLQHLMNSQNIKLKYSKYKMKQKEPKQERSQTYAKMQENSVNHNAFQCKCHYKKVPKSALQTTYINAQNCDKICSKSQQNILKNTPSTRCESEWALKKHAENV